MLPFFLRTVLCADGERLPTLVDRTTGVPDFDAVLWAVSSLRNSGYASATIAQALRSLAVLYVALRSNEIDLAKRLREGHLLDPADLEAIFSIVSVTSESTAGEIVSDTLDEQVLPRKVVSLETLRMSQTPRAQNTDVAPETISIRLYYIRKFLKWRVDQEILRANSEKRATLISLRDLVDDWLKDKTPSHTERTTLGNRMGINGTTQALLLDVLRPSHPENPWTDEFVRARNELIVNAFLALGVRRGELLGVRISDWRSDELYVLRRPDDKEYPRPDEPNTKTYDRVLPVTAELYQMMKSYNLLRHAVVRKNRKTTPFHIVSNSGDPLSASETNNVFRALDVIPGLAGITPHVLRHTYCENLAEELHNNGEDDNEILSTLRRLGGWSDNSNSPRRYTKRFAEERAHAAGLSAQKKLYITQQSIIKATMRELSTTVVI